MLTPSPQSLIPKFSFSVLNLNFGEEAVNADLPYASSGDANTSFGALITQVLNIVLVIGTIAVLFFLILGAIEWITAGGDSGKIQKAREKMTQAIIGLVVMISIVAIMMFVQQLLGICIINFGNRIGLGGFAGSC